MRVRRSERRQADLLAWAEAHSVLAFIVRDGLLERFAEHSPHAWSALRRLADAALQAGCCADESHYALLVDGERLRALIADAAPAAGKLMRLLPWCANPLAAAASKGVTRQRTAEKAAVDGGDYLRVVRVRHAGGCWERTLDWDEIATVREPAPGREAFDGGLQQPRFGRTSLREY